MSDNRRDPVRTPAYARNGGARAARGEWLVFIDADTVPEPGLLDAYIDPAPRADTAVLAGGIEDYALRSTAVARVNVARARMSHRATLERAGTPYAQTANCAIRRTAFEGRRRVRRRGAGGRGCRPVLSPPGRRWSLRSAPGRWCGTAAARRSPRGWRRWSGTGAARRGSRAAGPGGSPATGARPLVRRLGRDLADASSSLARRRPADAADPLLDMLGAAAFELGRLRPNTFGRRLAG